ncbi:MAG: hypothetical protein ACYTF0_00645, partial [Planctomycetota bacterium]
IPETAAINASAITACTITSDDRAKRPFTIAKIAAASHRPLSKDDLITPAVAPILSYDRSALRRLADRIGRKRAGRFAGAEAIDHDRLAILVGHQLHHSSTWRRQLYDAIEAHDGERPADGTLRKLHMYDPSLDSEFIVEREHLAKHYHIAVVATAGVELPTGMTPRQALFNFWDDMISFANDSGILPVVVLGPTKAHPEHQDQIDALWDDLEQLVHQRHPGVPIIDLRPIGRADYQRFASGQSKACAERLASGISEVRALLDSLDD